MSSLRQRIDRLEEQLVDRKCTCPPIMVIRERDDVPLSDAEEAAQLARFPSCVVHGAAPGVSVVVVLLNYSVTHRDGIARPLRGWDIHA